MARLALSTQHFATLALQATKTAAILPKQSRRKPPWHFEELSPSGRSLNHARPTGSAHLFHGRSSFLAPRARSRLPIRGSAREEHERQGRLGVGPGSYGHVWPHCADSRVLVFARRRPIRGSPRACRERSQCHPHRLFARRFSSRQRSSSIPQCPNRIRAHVLEVYAAVNDAGAERRAIEKSEAVQDRLWTIASGVARRDTRNTFLDLTGSVIKIIDIGEQQTAAFNSHVPGVIIGLVALSTLSAAFLFGLSLGRANFPNGLLAAIFCLLFSATLFTILDLDHAQGRFIGVDVSPLQLTLSDMVRGRTMNHNSNVSQLHGTKLRPRSSQPTR